MPHRRTTAEFIANTVGAHPPAAQESQRAENPPSQEYRTRITLLEHENHVLTDAVFLLQHQVAALHRKTRQGISTTNHNFRVIEKTIRDIDAEYQRCFLLTWSKLEELRQRVNKLFCLTPPSTVGTKESW